LQSCFSNANLLHVKEKLQVYSSQSILNFFTAINIKYVYIFYILFFPFLFLSFHIIYETIIFILV